MHLIVPTLLLGVLAVNRDMLPSCPQRAAVSIAFEGKLSDKDLYQNLEQLMENEIPATFYVPMNKSASEEDKKMIKTIHGTKHLTRTKSRDWVVSTK